MAYEDLFNEAIDDIAAKLATVSGLRVVTDPTRLVPNCVFIQAPSFTTFGGNGNIVTMQFPIKIVGSGPAGLPVLRDILSISAKVLLGGIAILSGQPGTLEIGGAQYPCYDLTMNIQAQAA